MSDVMTISKRNAAGLEEVLRTLLLDSENKVPAERLRIVGALANGAVIESGSNANGEYVRFADGTQSCWGTSPESSLTFSPYGDIFQTTYVITFPAQFINNNVSCIASAIIESQAPWANVLNIARSSVRLRAFDIADRSNLLIVFYWFAIGRWKA